MGEAPAREHVSTEPGKTQDDGGLETEHERTVLWEVRWAASPLTAEGREICIGFIERRKSAV